MSWLNKKKGYKTLIEDKKEQEQEQEKKKKKHIILQKIHYTQLLHHII